VAGMILCTKADPGSQLWCHVMPPLPEEAGCERVVLLLVFIA